MQNRLRLAIIVALFFGMIAGYGIYNFLRQQRLAMDALKQSTRDVVVAVKEIPSGTVVTDDMIGIVPYLQSSIPAGTFSSPEQVNGKVVRATVAAGEPVLESRLGEKAGLTVLLTPGQRAMAVRVDEIIGVSGFIAPNDRVDVIANVTPSGAGEDAQDGQIAKIVLQNRRVLAVAQTMEEKKDGKPQVVNSITLELTPEEAEKLSIASLEGHLILALRGPHDEDIVETQGITKSDLLALAPHPQQQQQIEQPTTIRGKYQVEVYQGSAKSVQEF
jgi:pilus assembly protein CpaB